MLMAGLPILKFTHTDTGLTGSPETTHTASGLGIGAASDDRYVVVCFVAETTTTVPSCTIGGVSATLAKHHDGGTGGQATIWYRKVTAGTTLEVVVTTGTSRRGLLHVGVIRGSASLSVVDTQGSGSTGASSRSVTPVVLAGEIAIFCTHIGGADVTITWSGGAVVEEAETFAIGSLNCGSASLESVGAAVTATYSASQPCSLASATFRG